MFEYLYDAKYKKAKKNYNNAKSKINKINKIKNDITNDSSSINVINRKIDYINSDISQAIFNLDICSKISSKLNELKEPYQCSDSNLSSANTSLDNEIHILRNEMNNSESVMVTIKNRY